MQGDIIQRDSCGEADRGSGSSRGYSQKKQHKTALFISEKRQKTRKKARKVTKKPTKNAKKRPFFGIKTGVYIAPYPLIFGYISSENGGKRLLYIRQIFQKGIPPRVLTGCNSWILEPHNGAAAAEPAGAVGQPEGGGSLDGSEPRT